MVASSEMSRLMAKEGDTVLLPIVAFRVVCCVV